MEDVVMGLTLTARKVWHCQGLAGLGRAGARAGAGWCALGPVLGPVDLE